MPTLQSNSSSVDLGSILKLILKPFWYTFHVLQVQVLPSGEGETEGAEIAIDVSKSA